jgi:hypothetical protein
MALPGQFVTSLKLVSVHLGRLLLDANCSDVEGRTHRIVIAAMRVISGPPESTVRDGSIDGKGSYRGE